MIALRNVPNIEDLEDLKVPYKAILWDMDGTIMNTEALHAGATVKLLDLYNPTHTHNTASIEKLGYGEIDSIVLERLQEQSLLTDITLEKFLVEKNDWIMKLLDHDQHEKIFDPKVKKGMQELKEADIPQAVVTSSEKQITEKLLTYLGLDYFNFVITRSDTKLNKPHPDPYLLACAKLKLDPKDTIVFEDSVVGAEAASAARANVFKAAWYLDQE